MDDWILLFAAVIRLLNSIIQFMGRRKKGKKPPPGHDE